MADVRKVRKLATGVHAIDGAGVSLVRVLGRNDVIDFDPFLMLDAFDSNDPRDYIKGFPWHPHRGIETITYLVAGIVEHGDSLGNKGAIRDGDCQWMTAGSGIIHQEMPRPSERLFGVQLWLNLPARNKFAPPRYRDLLASSIPTVVGEGFSVKIISGTYGETRGAVDGDYVKPLYLDVELEPNMEFMIPSNPDDTAFAYIMAGSADFGPPPAVLIGARHAVLLGRGDTVRIMSGDNGARFLLLAAPPLAEPVAWGGPIVMNTREELAQAFADLDNGTFIRP